MTMASLALYAQILGIGLSLMTLLWLVSLGMKDASVVDRYWGVGFSALYAVTLWSGPAPSWRAYMVFGLLIVWGLRLSLYIHARNRGKGEDPRYVAMRHKRGKQFWWVSLFSVFWLQGLIQTIVAAPVVFVVIFPQAETFTAFDAAGVLLWLIGFLFETIADRQMATFKADPANRGQVCRTGLWSWSRHPNYFGEATLWWGFGLIALNVSGGYWTLVSPALMTFLLIRVSGVSLLESQLVHSKPGYAAYVKEVPAFFPGRRRS